MPKAAKRRRAALAGTGVNSRKLQKVLSVLRRSDAPIKDLSLTARQIDKAVLEFWNEFSTTHKVGTFEWEFASIAGLLSVTVERSSDFRSLLRRAFAETPSAHTRPWGMIWYADEITPGNVLRQENLRKSMIGYCALKSMLRLQLGHSDLLWLPIAALRATKAKKALPGSYSQAMAIIVKQAFIVDRIAYGVTLDLGGGEVVRIHLELENFLADADAIRALLSVKGASGKLPCPCCLNVTTDVEACRRHPGRLVTIYDADTSHWVLATDDDLFEKADTLAADKLVLGTTKFDEKSKNLGITFSEGGVLFDHALRPFFRPTQILTFDAMHNLVSNGIAQKEMTLLLVRLNGLKPKVGIR